MTDSESEEDFDNVLAMEPPPGAPDDEDNPFNTAADADLPNPGDSDEDVGPSPLPPHHPVLTVRHSGSIVVHQDPGISPLMQRSTSSSAKYASHDEIRDIFGEEEAQQMKQQQQQQQSPTPQQTIPHRSPPPRRDEQKTRRTPTPPARPQIVGGSQPSSFGVPTSLSMSSMSQRSDQSNTSGRTFASSMTQNFDTVSKQVESGIYTTRRVSAVIRKLCTLEADYAKGILKVLEAEEHRIKHKMNDDGMKIFVGQWMEIIKIFKEVGKSHAHNSEELMSSFVRSLDSFNDECERERKMILAQERKVSGEMQESSNKVRKGLLNTSKLIEQTRNAMRTKEQQAEEEKAIKKGGANLKQKVLTNLKAKANKYVEKYKGSIDDMLIKGSQSAREYETAIVEANRRQDIYLKQDLPTVFSGMQTLETRRLERLKSECSKMAELKLSGEKEREGLYEKIVNVARDINPDLNITSFIDDWIYEKGDPVPISHFEYDLEVRADDIKAGRLTGNPNTVFHTTLERCMELQQQTAPELAVPRILHVMIQKIKDLGGLQTEGIFRITPDLEQLRALRESIDNGDYSVMSRIDSPHLPASLLKAWLRELSEPIFSVEAYERAVEIGKGKGKDSPELRQMLQEMCSSLPELSQRIITELAKLAREVASDENFKVNKMDYTNLGVVFAPGLLRNPSEDPIQLLQNAKYETSFTSMLLQYYGT